MRAALARHRRTGKGMAAQLGWNHMYMSRRLTGRVAFDVNDLAAIAAALKVPVSSFFGPAEPADLRARARAGVRRPGFCPPQVTAVAA